MRKEYIEIGGRLFRLVPYTTKAGKSIDSIAFRYDDIFDAYGRPSHIKVSIWLDWKKWADDLDFTIGISSRNTSQFTIVFHGFYNNKVVSGYITKTRNEVTIV